jgi:hypothetical protein
VFTHKRKRKAGATSNAGSDTSFQTLDQSPPFAASSISWMVASMSTTKFKIKNRKSFNLFGSLFDNHSA